MLYEVKKQNIKHPLVSFRKIGSTVSAGKQTGKIKHNHFIDIMKYSMHRSCQDG